MTENKTNTSGFTREQELPRNAVFQQMFSENSMKDQFYPQKQKTRSNYRFIVLLNLIAFALALVGGISVYYIFKSQEIQLLEGEGAVKTLELSILQQLDEKRQDEFNQKEAELEKLRQALAESEKGLAQTKNNIKAEAEREFIKQKDSFEQALASELRGKSEQEQAEIRARYEAQLKKLEDELNTKIQSEYKRVDDSFQKENSRALEQRKRIQEEVEKAKLQREQSQQKIQAIAQTNLTPAPLPAISRSKNDDVAKIFLAIQVAMQRQDFKRVGDRLTDIKNFYKIPNATESPIQAKVDLFIVDVLEDYVTNTTKLSNLSIELQTLQSNNSALSNQEMLKIKEEIDRLKLSNDVLLEFKMQILSNNDGVTASYTTLIEQIQNLTMQLDKGKSEQFDQQMAILKEKEPLITELLSSYSNYQIALDTQESEGIFTQAERAFKAKNYQKAVESYQSIIRLHPKTEKMETVLDHLYQSMKGLFENTNFTVVDTPVANQLQTERAAQQEPLTQSEIAYFQNPEGYVFDIVDNEVIVILVPGSKLKSKIKVQFVRMVNEGLMQLHYIADGSVTKIQANVVYISLSQNSRVRIGDLIYLKND
ncbi:MAG: hypothetical protein ACRCS8_05565 [Brevinema sp.]